MNELAEVKNTTISMLVDRASAALMAAKSSGEVLEARNIARSAYDAAKSAGRFALAQGAHDEVVAAVRKAQAQALLIEARAAMRLADEYGAAQERGEVAKRGNPNVVDPDNCKATTQDLNIRRDEIHEARKLRDAEAQEPGKAERVLKEIAERGEEPTKAKFRKEMIAQPEPPPRPDLRIVETPTEDPETVDPERRKLERLTTDALIDEVLGLRADLADAKALAKKQAEEIKALKEQIKGFDGEQADTIRRQAQIIRHKESEMYRANEKADRALARAKHLEKRVAELESLGIAV